MQLYLNKLKEVLYYISVHMWAVFCHFYVFDTRKLFKCLKISIQNINSQIRVVKSAWRYFKFMLTFTTNKIGIFFRPSSKFSYFYLRSPGVRKNPWSNYSDQYGNSI